MAAARGRTLNLNRHIFAALCSVLGCLSLSSARADDVASALYVRQDTDHTTVISPHLHVDKDVNEQLSIDVNYAADVWTSASIDIRTSASVRPVTEQRDELSLAVTQSLADVSLSANYRVSLEPDYVSNGGGVGASYNLANNAATLAGRLHVFADRVGRSGNPNFSRGVATYVGNFAYTQIVNPEMLAQLTYEIAHIQGYQASPYRFVGSGPDATGFGCTGAEMCWPERVPRGRTRHAFAFLFRRAIVDAFSLGLAYRFYIDDWSLTSHTLMVELGFNLAEHSLLMLRYRYYEQGAVNFYKLRYTELTSGDFRTRDRELSAMLYHRVGLEFEQRLHEFERGRTLAALLAVGGNFYQYREFVGLTESQALEVTLALTIGL
jgi:opacity protein-like surface antigen